MAATQPTPNSAIPAHPIDPSPPPTVSVVSDIDVPALIQKGISMTRVSDNGQKKAVFRIDPDEGNILWDSQWKDGIIPIESIKELRSGFEGRYYREQFKLKADCEDRWITIIYILDGTYKTLHLIAETKEVFQMWDATLRKLYDIRRGLTTGLGNTELRQAVWEKQYWKGADQTSDQKLAFDEVEGLCRRLNVDMPTPKLLELFEQADVQNRAYLDFADFQRFVKALKRRPELETLYQKLCCGSSGALDYAAFEKFQRDSQQSSLSVDELKATFAKYASPTEKSSTAPSVMTLDAFTSFLLSSDNSAFPPEDSTIWQDMTRPLSEYYISSSHNTYLVGHQLVGVSTIEGYIRALLQSCRSVELDIYDGDEEPVIFHGNTLTSKVALRDICHAIAKYAFVTSPYAVIISAEVHCGLAQQDIMVKIMTEIFGDALISAPIDGRPKISVLPSPEELKMKFLVKAKNLYVTAQIDLVQAKKVKAFDAESSTSDSSSSSSSSDDSHVERKVKEELKEIKSKWRQVRGKGSASPVGVSVGKLKTKVKAKAKPKPKMSFALASLLVYTVGVKCHGFSDDASYAPEHIFSLSESTANKLLKEQRTVTELIRHNETHVVRIYPKGLRVNSTNYEPHYYWAVGAQLVAINLQTFDLGYMINQAMFQRNGRSGYVLKPLALRNPEKDKDLLSNRTKHFFDVTIISAQQLPLPKDSNGQEILKKSSIDPLVEVSLHIPEWSQSPFLPESSSASGAIYSPATGGTATSATSGRTVSFRTGAVKNNGFNPVWQEELCLPFDCIGDMKDLIFVEFSVWQEGKVGGDYEPLAVYCTSLGSLQLGQ